jgi:glycosyltransferase involved in cell wall biosynthesis
MTLNTDLSMTVPQREDGQRPVVATGACAGSPLRPRVFVDLTASMMHAGGQGPGVTRSEVETARRLLARPRLNPVPVVLDDDGTMFALGEETVETILTARPAAVAPRLRLRRPPEKVEKLAPAGEQPGGSAAPQPGAPPPQDERPSVLRMTTAAARTAVRNGVRMLPGAIREDSRAILIHGRQIVRTLLYGRRPAPVEADAACEQNAATLEPEAVGDPNANDVRLPALKAVVYPQAGDVLWTSGLRQGVAPLRRLAEMDRYRGMEVAAVCCDLAGLDHADLHPPIHAGAVVEAAALDLLRTATLVVARSEWSRGALLRFAEASGVAAPPVEVIPPGRDFAGAHPPTAAGGDALADLVGSRRFALTVGALEPRTNHLLLVRIWEALVADPAFDLDLVIVGRAGHGHQETERALEDSVLLGTRIKWIEPCPDGVLSSLFDATEVVLSPSFADDSGLPIIEALARGRPVIASNRGAQPEAAMGLATLLDPQDDRGWIEALRAIAHGGRRSVVPPEIPDWDCRAEAITRSLLALMSRSRGQ